MDKPMDVLREFPVRKSKKQKAQFREAVRAYTAGLGYEMQVEKGSFGSQNVILGDPERADYLITAHYDTCAHLPFPNLITPCNLPLFLLYQIAVGILMCVLVFLVGGFTLFLTDSFPVYLAVLYATLFLMAWLMLCGPANKHNANDNTSGVVTVLETAAQLPVALRGRVCFVLFDLEEAGLLGSSAYRKRHRKAIKNQLMLNVDCVGEGDELVLFPSKRLKKDPAALEQLEQSIPAEGTKTITLRQRGFSIYPSDQRGFPKGVGIAAFRRSRWAGLYLGRIHTNRDTILEEENVILLRSYLLHVVSGAQVQKGIEI